MLHELCANSRRQPARCLRSIRSSALQVSKGDSNLHVVRFDDNSGLFSTVNFLPLGSAIRAQWTIVPMSATATLHSTGSAVVDGHLQVIAYDNRVDLPDLLRLLLS